MPGLMTTVLLVVVTALLEMAQAEPHNYLEKFKAKDMVVHVGSAGGAIQVDVNTTELRASGQWASVSVQGIPDPRPTDLLALFSPPDAFKQLAAPIKYENLTASPDYLRTGSATLRQVPLMYWVSMAIHALRPPPS
jgi:hypothetical protein